MAAPVHVLVVADGEVDSSLLVELAASEPAPFIIGADGGAARLAEVGRSPDLVVGDLDSLAPAARERLEAAGVELRVSAPDKDESDTELALMAALAEGASRITVLGALAVVRPEHSLANLLLLADPRLDGVDVAIAGHGSRITRIGSAEGPGTTGIEGRPGDFVSLFPLGGDVAGVSTDGLRFRLDDEDLPVGPSRGLSNELLGRQARVSSRRGRLLVIHTRRPAAAGSQAGGT